MSTTAEVLAEALPRLLQAVLGAAEFPPGSGAPWLGGITKEVGDHLIAEVCSIFLLNDGGDALQLKEAHGYRQVAIGTPHDLSSGLTGRIYSKKVELILNYTVQDPAKGWAGKLDPQLETYCWSLLGVPIVSPRLGACLGVLKFENKRKSWSNIEDGRYLRNLVPRRTFSDLPGGEKQICTPKDIAAQLNAMFAQTPGRIDPTAKDRIVYLSNRLLEATESISVEIAPGWQGDLGPLRPDLLPGVMDSISWAVDGLQQELSVLRTDHPTMVLLHTLLRAFSLALGAYNPFNLEDLYLARAVAAMIGAAIDAREAMLKAGRAVRAEALTMLRHGLLSVSGEFLTSVSEVMNVVQDNGLVEAVQPSGATLCMSAIVISGSCGVAATDANEIRKLPEIEFQTFYSNFLRGRLGFYSQLIQLKNKRMSFQRDPPVQLVELRIPMAYGLVGAVLDCVVVNAVQKGGDIISFTASRRDGWIALEVHDDGAGIPDKLLVELNKVPREIVPSEHGGFGLKACMKLVSDAGFRLEVVRERGTMVRLLLPIKNT
jgi:signal transduction histidine kinase